MSIPHIQNGHVYCHEVEDNIISHENSMQKDTKSQEIMFQQIYFEAQNTSYSKLKFPMQYFIVPMQGEDNN